MNGDRWHRLKSLVADALEQPPSERAAFVARACPGDAALRAEALRLVEAAGEDDLVSPIASLRPVAERDDIADAPILGRRIGAYEVVRLLGRGGMGAVYEVRRADGHYEARGALKLVRHGVDSPALRQRFQQERQILASLEHPHIARLLDGGVTDDRQPFLVMEYVEGEPLPAFCDARRLSTDERLALFLQVCDAVAYAHRNLVVHRDLKPSNILVTADGTVKLLDFGIAKLLDEAATGGGPETWTLAQPFTPEYAAPEQLAGGRITTATDVYQLGAVLYELLAGRRPHDVSGLTPAAVERLVTTAEPRRPSAAVVDIPPTRPAGTPLAGEGGAADPEAIARARGTHPDRLRRRLGGDLDTVVLKALRKEPGARYVSAEALGEDLRRHLAGEPVRARPATFAYRAGKLVRRYRTAVAAAVLLFVVATALSVVYTVRVAAERDRAEAALLETRSALAFLQQMIWAAGPEEGDPDMPIGAVLDSAAARIDAELADRPAVARTIHAAVGYAYMSMGRYEAAEAHTRRALALHGDALDGGDADSARATLLVNLGLILTGQGRYDEAIPLHEESLALARELAPEGHLLAVVLNGYATTLTETGAYAESAALLKEAVPLYRAQSDDTGALRALNNLVAILQYDGRHEEAIPRYREVAALMRAARGGDDHYQIGVVLSNLAASLSLTGQADEATATYEEALGVLERTVEPAHPNRLTSRISYAEHLMRMGDLAEANTQIDTVIATVEVALGEVHPLTAFALSVGGQVDCRHMARERGAERLRRSFEARRSLYPEGHWLTANSGSLLGECLAGLGRFDAAESLLVEGYETMVVSLGTEHPNTVKARARVAQLYDAWGRTEGSNASVLNTDVPARAP